ncbi:uncharacterized protein MYCFIDRAFT_178493 [Pseudocercospora fijiensis CIRAD86]|uniref:Uncharacterized protein n=1 Tax=Pseudocercospora fijiensis (strain CIRAD86) TaxID=383855 RepID=M3A1T7_PSEFD|nr:uncharacterized protein MYCFIDRAFT_178493 [Pseudocercospora fijiensis CIRAD86]EME78346.1 hypothetical protein MYCFIDRAFT_178493 [Pseudocercospora fijiensis CIRAD86]
MQSKYFFVNVDKNEEIAIGFDGAFLTNLLDSVSDDTNFDTLGASCLNLINDANGKAATYGYFTSSENEKDITEQHEGSWTRSCFRSLTRKVVHGAAEIYGGLVDRGFRSRMAFLQITPPLA